MIFYFCPPGERPLPPQQELDGSQVCMWEDIKHAPDGSGTGFFRVYAPKGLFPKGLPFDPVTHDGCEYSVTVTDGVAVVHPPPPPRIVRFRRGKDGIQEAVEEDA